jgi:fructose-specific phosphotransferase system component IIB
MSYQKELEIYSKALNHLTKIKNDLEIIETNRSIRNVYEKSTKKELYSATQLLNKIKNISNNKNKQKEESEYLLREYKSFPYL